MRLAFAVQDDGSGAFVYGPAYESVFDSFHLTLDARDRGMPDRAYLAALKKLAVDAPDFVDAHAHIALYYHYQGKPKLTLDAALVALGIANSLIPEGFTGRIEWAVLDNRPYLRAMHIALGAYMRLKRHKDAVVLIELMLARNPNDNQGVRYLLGPQALRAGDPQRALTLLHADPEYAPNWYELALCHLELDDVISAATALRKGFIANPYIAEILGGHPDPGWLPIDNSFLCGDLVSAHDYIAAMGARWTARPSHRSMVRWLYNHPAVLAERGALLEAGEALMWEKDSRIRGELLDTQVRRFRAIDDKLSRKLVLLRDRNGLVTLPWMHHPSY